LLEKTERSSHYSENCPLAKSRITSPTLLEIPYYIVIALPITGFE
jgi:hypothetical protein